MAQLLRTSRLAWCWAWMGELGDRFADAVDEVWEPFLDPDLG